MMGIAEGMLAIVKLQIRSPMVMHGPSLKVGQDADVLHPLMTTFGLNSVVSQVRRSSHMQPVQTAFHAHSALIKMGNIGGNDLLFDAGKCLFSLPDEGAIGSQDKALAGRMPVEILEQFTSTLQRQQLVIVQINRLRFEPRAVLYRLPHLCPGNIP